MPQYLEKTPKEWDLEMAQTPFFELYRRRQLPGADQAYLGPFEHRAFTRETVRDQPAMALPLTVATPLYEIAKLLQLQKGRSPPSWNSLIQGELGITEGLMQGLGGINNGR